jgi:PKD repeat protein
MKWRFFVIALACMAAPVWAFAEYIGVEYSPGRCDGSVPVDYGDQVHFTPNLQQGPQPFDLWILVQSGSGNVVVSDGQGDATDGLYLASGDLLFFQTMPPFDLYFQGGVMQMAWGGAVLGPPATAVCSTGDFGPVVLRVDGRYDALLQSSTAGTSVQVAAYGTLADRTSGTLDYVQASGYALQGTFSVPHCSGTACCNPVQSVFPVNKAAGLPYSVYTVASSPQVNFDYLLGTPSPLQASASAVPTSGAPPLAVSFTGTAAGGLAPYTWDWNFGDGSAHKTVQNPSHTYQSGTFHPVLAVRDASGNTAQDTHLTITAVVPYEASANATPVQGSAPLPVSFSATARGGTAPYTYEWSFGDGSPSSAEQNPSHTFAAIGTYHPVLTVRDLTGAVATDSHLVIKALGPGALSALAQADQTYGLLPLPVAFTGSASGGTPPYTYAWDFGDGSSVSTEMNPIHTYGIPGSFTVTLTARDAGGQSASDDHLRIYAASSFVATASAAPSSGPAPLDVQFSVTLAGGTPPYLYQWDFGDGTTSTDSAPAHTFSMGGSYAVILVVRDAIGQAAVDNRLLIAVGSLDAPVITAVNKGTDPFTLTVKGSKFQPGCVVLIGQTAVPVVSYKSPTKVVAKGGSTLKGMVPKGIPVCVQVKNPDGFTSPCFTYTK